MSALQSKEKLAPVDTPAKDRGRWGWTLPIAGATGTGPSPHMELNQHDQIATSKSQILQELQAKCTSE